jgi:predicted small lipoprotein YifL
MRLCAAFAPASILVSRRQPRQVEQRCKEFLVRDKQRRYHAYLLRLWEVQTPEASVWRSSLEEPGNGIKKTFSSLSSLFAFLDEQITGCGQKEQDLVVPEDSIDKPYDRRQYSEQQKTD